MLLEEIARGGMGVVYRARQAGLNRIVALKVLPGAAFASASFRARFQHEAETAARLKHPGIVAVHEVGQALGQPFLSMDFIDGPSLATRLAQSRMTPEFAAQIMCEVARAVSHAHLQGVAHRDLKPSNILLTRDNHPILTDFGLACFLDLESLEGLTLDMMGSLPYLPPERLASGKSSDPVMEDVYGLGAVLYHCLKGRPPFVADSLNAVLAAVGESEPVPPRRLNHSVPADLETICLKCLEKSPAARYAGAAAVAEDLDRFLRGEPIVARPLSPANHLIKLVRRKPLTSSLIFALAATMLAGAVVSTLAWRSAASNAADYRAMAEKRRVDLYSANLSAASAARESGNRNQARELLFRCRPLAGETDLRGCEWSIMHQLLQSRELFSLKAHDHILTALTWHPEGHTLLSGGHDGSLKSWQRAEDHQLIEIQSILPPGNPRIQQIQYLPDGRSFLVAEGENIRCRKPGDDAPLWEIPGTRFSLTADGTTLAVTTAGMFFFEPTGKISLWRIPPEPTRKPTLQQTFPFSARAVAISPDGRWLATSLPKKHASR
jgi:serine/threonine protein kinase